MRTGKLRDSIKAVSSGTDFEVGTDLFYGKIHQRGGPIDAQYRRRSGSGGGRLRLPRIPTVPTASSAARLAQARLRRARIRRRQKARNVKLPARRFLGIDKRDRKKSTKILMDKLNEALR